MHKFKQAVHFPGKKMGNDKNGFALPAGPSHSFKHGDVVEVPDVVLEHPYFQKLVEAGLVEEAEPELPKESLAERNKRLAKKLAESSTPEPEDSGVEEPSEDEDEEESEEKPKASKDNHKKGKHAKHHKR